VTRDENSDAMPPTPDMFDRRAVCVKLEALNVGLWDDTTLCDAPSEDAFGHYGNTDRICWGHGVRNLRVSRRAGRSFEPLAGRPNRDPIAGVRN
jgi:hypothetical protein